MVKPSKSGKPKRPNDERERQADILFGPTPKDRRDMVQLLTDRGEVRMAVQDALSDGEPKEQAFQFLVETVEGSRDSVATSLISRALETIAEVRREFEQRSKD